MFCKKCGNEIGEGESFCSSCGARIDRKEEKMESVKAKKRTWIVIVSICVLLALITLIAVMFGKKDDTVDMEEEENGEYSVSSDDSERMEEGRTEQVSALYQSAELPAIDLSRQDHVPATKAPGMVWDDMLFYWLEDTDTLTPADDNIAKCTLSKMLFRNAESGNQIQYEIYRDPSSGDIYKIVSIEEQDGEYKLVDFYYQNGKPNFMFERYDSVYTPTYATIDKVGERFYFDNDVMVKWRIIREPGMIEEYVLTPDDAWYSQSDYFEETEELRQIYDEEEKKRLNQAYNTYEAVVNGKGVGIVEGTVHDMSGNPQADVQVNIYRKLDDVLLYQTTTDKDGVFSTYVYLDGEECYLLIYGTEEFKRLTANELDLKDSVLIHSFSLILHKTDSDQYPVTLQAYPAEAVRTGEDQTNGEPIGEITAFVREGSGAYTGHTLATVSSEGDEAISVYLESGTYTVQVSAQGYADTFLEIEVTEKAVEQTVYMVSDVQEGQTVVVMTWEGSDTDLDLTLFTPYQSTGGDMAHIGGKNLSDDYGNQLIADNSSACEVMIINSGERGSYKLYVNDYTDSTAGNYTSDKLFYSNVHVYIYNGNGFVGDYKIPAGQTGVVWEVAEVNGTAVIPVHRVYRELTDKVWWIESKEKADWNDVRTTYLAYLEEQRALESWEAWGGMDYYERVYNEFSLDYIDGDDIPELIYGHVYAIDEGNGYHVLYYDNKTAGGQKIKELTLAGAKSGDGIYSGSVYANMIEYIEGTGMINAEYSLFGSTHREDHIYQLTEDGFVHLADGIYNTEIEEWDGVEWDGREITKGEYIEKWTDVYARKGDRSYNRHNYTPDEIKEILQTPRTTEELKTYLKQNENSYDRNIPIA